MARNRTSRFGVDDGLFENHGQKQEVQEEQERYTRGTGGLHKKYKEFTQQTQQVQEVQEEKYRTIGSTQGRKGHKLKRTNMAFSDLNHEYITMESRRRGISATEFVNQIIEKYRKGSEGYIE